MNELFTNTLYRIPDYQRGYAWTTDQLKAFWDDLYNLNDSKNHYTGVLTVKSVPQEIINSVKWNEEQWVLRERGYKAFYIVDGQQRLTTSIIFIQALADVYQAMPDNSKVHESDIYVGSYSLKEIKETFLLLKKPPHNIIATYKFGYESDNPSFDFLRSRIFNENSTQSVDETFYTLNLENAKKFFVQKLRGVFDIEGQAGLVALFKKLTVNFRFNLYEIEDDFDVFVAFETMNNRGKKLSNLELLKNRLIYLTTLYDEQELKEDDRISLRTKIDTAWKEVYYQLGRNKHHPLNDDDFLVAHWIIYFQYSRQKGDDYINFLLNDQFTPRNIFTRVEIPVTSLEEYELITDSDEESEDESAEDIVQNTLPVSKLKPKEIENYVLSLQAAAVHWYNSFNPVNNPDLTHQEQVWIDRLNRIGIAYFRPLVTASFLNESISSEDRVNLFKGIERFIFIAFRMKSAASTYRNSEFFKAARHLRNGDWTLKYIISLLDTRIQYSFYNGEEEETYFDYGYFKKYLEKHFQNGGGYYRWNALRYFLYEYEMELVQQRGSQKIDWNLFVKNEGDRVSIEHILPQTPDNKYWKEVLKPIPKSKRTRLIDTLGNLVPLSLSINSSLQNDAFDDKKKAKLDDRGNKVRQGYNNGSHSEIEVSLNDQWTHEEILERGLRLLSFMEKRWNFKFESEEDKIALLGLEFITEKAD